MTKARANATAEAAKGDIRVGSGTNATSVLGVGTNGQALVANSGATTGLNWATPTDTTKVPLSTVTAKGDLIAATASGAVSNLAVGTNGQVLTAASGQTTGLQWATPVSGSMTSIATGTFSGASTTISSIPQTYVSLYMIIRGIYSTTAADISISINGSANAYYTAINAGNIVAYNAANIVSISTSNGATAAHLGAMCFVINDYTNTTYGKSFQLYGVLRAANYLNISNFGTWANAAAVTSIVISQGTALSGGTYTLYGVN